MHAETSPASPGTDTPPAAPPAPRLWLPVTLLGLYWVLLFVIGRLDKPYFVGFLYGLGSSGLLALVLLVWWWTNRRVPFRDRLAGFVLFTGGGLLAYGLCHPSVAFALLTPGVPLVLTTWTAWELVARKAGLSWRRWGAIPVVLLSWGALLLVRIDGVNSDLQANMRWRWSPSAEDLFLAEKAQSGDVHPGSPAVPEGQAAVALTAGDWPEFRGPDRDGIIHGVPITADWRTNPPRPRWRQRVGPAWSSVIVIGDHLFFTRPKMRSFLDSCFLV